MTTSKVLHSVGSKLLFSFLTMLLIPTILVGFLSYQTTAAKVKDDMRSTASANVQLLNESISHFIQPEIDNIAYLSSQINHDSYTVNKGLGIKSLIQSFATNHKEIGNIDFGSTDGFYTNHPVHKQSAGYDARMRGWYIGAMQNKGQVFVQNPYASKSLSGVMVVGVSKVISDGTGVIHFEIPITTLSTLVRNTKIGQTGYIVMLGSNGTTIVDPTHQAGTYVSKIGWAQAMFKGDIGTYAYNQNGKAINLVYVTNPVTGWKIGGILFTSDVASATYPILLRTAMVIILALLVGGVFAFFIIRSMTKPLKMLVETSNMIRSGDLSQRVTIENRDEFGQVALSFNTMVDSLAILLGQVSQTAELLAASSEQLTSSAEETSKSAEHVAMAIQEIAVSAIGESKSAQSSMNSMQKMSRSVEQIATRAHHVTDSVQKAFDVTMVGNDFIRSAITQMSTVETSINSLSQMVNNLEQRSKDIVNIVSAITNISTQTNLLALNAAIEAARAGESGRGFAVVADEVRKLAEQSSSAANEISQLISLIQTETDQAVESMRTAQNEVSQGIGTVHIAGESFEKIRQSVKGVTTQILEVSSAAQQLAASSEEVVQSMSIIVDSASNTASSTEGVSTSAEEQLATMEEITASASTLSRTAEELQELISRFQV